MSALPIANTDCRTTVTPCYFHSLIFLLAVGTIESCGNPVSAICSTWSHLAFTAAAVWLNYEQFIQPHFVELVERSARSQPPQFDLYVSGGGARNPFLMKWVWQCACTVIIVWQAYLGIPRSYFCIHRILHAIMSRLFIIYVFGPYIAGMWCRSGLTV